MDKFKELFFKYVPQIITKQLVKWGLKLQGPLGWIASLFINKFTKWAWEYAKRGYNWVMTKPENKKDLKEYEEKINKPDASAEEIKKAGKDFLES